MSTATLPERNEVQPGDCWDLGSLYESDAAWEADFETLEGRIEKFESYRGRLGESPHVLAEALQFDSDFDRDSKAHKSINSATFVSDCNA